MQTQSTSLFVFNSQRTFVLNNNLRQSSDKKQATKTTHFYIEQFNLSATENQNREGGLLNHITLLSYSS